jgi:hypothetical protein
MKGKVFRRLAKHDDESSLEKNKGKNGENTLQGAFSKESSLTLRRNAAKEEPPRMSFPI